MIRICGAVKVSFAAGVALCIAVIVGCATPELQHLQSSTTSDEGYRAYNEVIENLSRIPVIRNSNRYYIALGKGIRAEWAGNYQGAEDAFREGLTNPSYWQGEYGQKAKQTWPPLFRAYIGHALYKQGKVREALKQLEAAEPSFARLINQIPRDRHERGAKLFYAYLYKVYGRALERTGEEKRAMKMYQKGFGLGASELNADIARLQTTATSTSLAMEEAVHKAEQANRNGHPREALQQYMTALAVSAESFEGETLDTVMIQKSIEIACKLDPPPAISEEARRQAIFASTAVKEAKDEQEYAMAVKEYLKAISLAPWWADLYINTSLLFEEMGHYANAYSMLKLYLLAAPNAPDADQVKTKLYELEYKANQEAKK